MHTIANVTAREVLDSRGNPTVEADVVFTSGAAGRAIVPSGASTGSHEAVEMRDGDASRFLGRGVRRAVENANTVIAPALIGQEGTNQEAIDRMMIELDGTPSKATLGANAILAVSIAVARAAAAALGVPLYRYLGGVGARTLPVPMCNVLNGGAHADNKADIQEYMIFPHGAPSIREAVRWATEVYHSLRALLNEKGLSNAIGDEGGCAPDLENNEAGVRHVLEAIERAGYKPGEQISICLDVAASEFFSDGRYHFDGEARTREYLLDYFVELCDKYPIVSIEDPFDEDDWEGFIAMTVRLGDRIQIVGDDLFATNEVRLAEGIHRRAANTILIKLNQIGTVSETMHCIYRAQREGLRTIIAHRSGETEDTTIADLAVGTNAGQIKTGGLARTDRVAKYNQLMRIEEELGHDCTYGLPLKAEV